MRDNIFEVQIEPLFSDLESDLSELDFELSTTFNEELEIIEDGFSFSSSLKDISRFICVNLFEQLDGNIQAVLYVVNNWERLGKSLDDNSLVNKNDEVVLSVFVNVYYQTIDYFKKQFLTHLGEKVELDNEDIIDPQIESFISSTGLRQRKFSYLLEATGSNGIELVTSSTIRRFEIKQTEREKVEMLNSIFLRFILKPDESEELLLTLANKFPNLEQSFINILNQARCVNINLGDSIIEISPPFEEYSYQVDCMVRIYTFNGNGFDVLQYSLPYYQDEVDTVTRNLSKSFKARIVNTGNTNNFLSNNILSNLYICSVANPSTILNSFPSLVEFGGAKVIDIVSEIVNPQINIIEDRIHPFIVDYIKSPSFTNDLNKHRQFAQKYKQVFLSAFATLDSNVRYENPEIEELLRSGELLNAVINNEDVGSILLNASDGQVSHLSVSADGNCDSVSGILGVDEVQDSGSFSESEISTMHLNGKVMSLTKSGDRRLDLMSFTDSKGKERKLFICPVCQLQGNKNYVDICNDSCPSCNIKLSSLRLAAERNNLSKFLEQYPSTKNHNTPIQEGNGIFQVIFDLFGAVFSLF